MEKRMRSAENHYKAKTIWAKDAAEFIPERFRRIITRVVPEVYFLLFLFGVTSSIWPVPTFINIVGGEYGKFWAILVATSALISLVGLIFRLQIEIYSSIILTTLLAVYPLYIVYFVYHDPSNVDLSRAAVIFATMIYPIVPGWRVFDISVEIRKARQRVLYAEAQREDE